MQDALSVMNADRRKQILALLPLSVEAVLGTEERIAKKQKAFEEKNAAALRDILEEEQKLVQDLLAQYES